MITDFVLPLQVKERPDVGVYVKDLSSYVMNNADDLDKTMTLGNKNRESSFIYNQCGKNDESLYMYHPRATDRSHQFAVKCG